MIIQCRGRNRDSIRKRRRIRSWGVIWETPVRKQLVD